MSHQPSLEEQERILVSKAARMSGVLGFLVSACLLVWFVDYVLPAEKLLAKIYVESEVSNSAEYSKIENGIHVQSGLIAEEGYETVLGTCGSCHSMKLVTQNRASEEGWKDIIVWMQETQNLWDLGENEAIIVGYLGKHYGPKKQGRRLPLENISWYELED